MEKIIINNETILKESLGSWSESFKLGPTGYSSVMNTDDFQDPAASFNRIKLAIIAEARARVLKREAGENELILHVGGEVRFHTKESIELVSRIYAAHGIKVRRRANGKSSPIWYSSFGVFYEELAGGDNFSACNSAFYKGGWKPIEEEGRQLLGQGGLIAEEVRKIALGGAEILLAPVDPGFIFDDFEVTAPYVDYLKTIISAEQLSAVNEAGKTGFKAFFATLGGSMAKTSLEIFEKMGIQVGDGRVVDFLYAEEDPMFHNVGIVDGINHGADPVKWQVYKNIGAENTLINGQANVVFIWDPDGDCFNMVTKAPVSISEKAREVGLETAPFQDDPKNVCVYFKPYQAFLMLTAWRLENLKNSGDLEKFDWIIMEAFQTSRSFDELAGKFRVKVLHTPVGFKHFGKTISEIEAQLKNGNREDELTIEDFLGQEHELGEAPRILIMVEGNRGAAFGGSGFIKSKKGKISSMALKEKDGMQIGLMALGLAAELFNKQSCPASYYMDIMEKYEIQSRFQFREDVSLYDEDLTDPSELKRAKLEGLKKRNVILSFFQGLADKVRNGDLNTRDVSSKLNMKQSFVEFGAPTNVYWTGDGTFIEFSNYRIGIRSSVTDQVLKYYMEGEDSYFLNKVKRALLSIE